jgi:hypothetical protein
VEYYALQAKAVHIHGNARRRGNAAELLSQATDALATSFIDDIDNQRKRLDKFVIATNQSISAEARRTIDEGRENNRRILFVDVDQIVMLVKRYRLMQYVLFSDW